jgi:hypothetical protein
MFRIATRLADRAFHPRRDGQAAAKHRMPSVDDAAMAARIEMLRLFLERQHSEWERER